MALVASTIDWCESNYTTSYYIAEYWNSLSSLFITACGMYGIYKYPSFWLFGTLIPIGLSSFYFHATLSLLGQLLDEAFIMIAIASTCTYINIYIKPFCDPVILRNIHIIQMCGIFLFPEYNRFLLFAYGLYASQYVYSSSNTQTCMTFASVFWIIDYLCIFPQLHFHAMWHIGIGITAYLLFDGIKDTVGAEVEEIDSII